MTLRINGGDIGLPARKMEYTEWQKRLAQLDVQMGYPFSSTCPCFRWAQMFGDIVPASVMPNPLYRGPDARIDHKKRWISAGNMWS